MTRVDWIAKARAAKKKLLGKNYGGREKALLDAGWGDVNTARRAIVAYNFIELAKRKYRNDYEVLRNAPLSVVENLARWHGFDPEGALKAAHGWAKGDYNVHDLAEAMKAARDREARPTTKELSADQYRKAAAESVRTHVSNLVQGEVSKVELSFKETKDTPPIDYRLEWYPEEADGLKIRTVGVIIVGPYTNPSLYNKRRHEWIARAFGLAWFFDKVILVLPNGEFIEKYTSWIEICKKRAGALTKSRRQPDVSVVLINSESVGATLTDEYDSAIQSLSR